MLFSEAACPPRSGVNRGLVRDDHVDKLFAALLFRPGAPIDCRTFEDQVSRSRWLGAVASFGMCRGRLLFGALPAAAAAGWSTERWIFSGALSHLPLLLPPTFPHSCQVVSLYGETFCSCSSTCHNKHVRRRLFFFP